MGITSNKYVACTYELYAGSEEERELVEQTTAERPLEFIFGMGMMLPDFEQNLMGLTVGDKFDFTLTAKQAYGEYDEAAVVTLPKSIFVNAQGEFDAELVVEGAVLPMMMADGTSVEGEVVELGEDTVLMDFNHRLAGQTLHFIGEVLDEHEATGEEIAGFFNSGGCGSGCGCSGGCGDDEDDQPRGGCGGGCGCHG